MYYRIDMISNEGNVYENPLDYRYKKEHEARGVACRLSIDYISWPMTVYVVKVSRSGKETIIAKYLKGAEV